MLIVRVVQRRSPFTESLLTPINIWILIPITIWNTNDRWSELSFLWAETIITDDKDKEIELKHLKSVLQDNSYKPWMFSIPPKTANTSGTKSEVVSTRAQSFSLPHLQGVFRKLAHKRFQKARSWHIPQAFQDHQVTVSPPQRSDTQGKEMWDGVRNSLWGLWWFLS